MPQEKKQEQPVISLRDVYKSFNSHQVLRGVSFDIPAGKTTSIVGPSGCGKSVTMKISIRAEERVYWPDSGEVYVFGKNLYQLDNESLSAVQKRIGVVFQSNALYSDTDVRGNIQRAMIEHNRGLEKKVEWRQFLESRTRDLVRATGLIQRDEEYESLVRLTPDQLSGGMKKRVAFIRALFPFPELIILDEPTTSLDPLSSRDIYNLIEKITVEDENIPNEISTLMTQHSAYTNPPAISRQPRTNLIITHDLKLAFRLSDIIIYLYDGRPIFIGTPRQFYYSDQATDFLELDKKNLEGHLVYGESKHSF